MAQAKKCDRCGKLYECYVVKIKNEAVNALTLVEMDTLRQYHNKNFIELCPDCMAQFNEFLKNIENVKS